MGLDITHFKATKDKPPNRWMNEHIYVESDFDEDVANVPFNFFHKFIHEIDYQIIIKTVVLIETSNLALIDSYFMDYFNQMHFKIIVYSNLTQMEVEIKNFEKESNLFGIEFNDQEADTWIIRDYIRTEKRPGFYYEEIGYQRKGVNYEKFESRFDISACSIFALREDFEYLFKCIGYCWESDTDEIVKERRKEFKAAFLDKFEEGASFLFMG